MEDLFEGCLSGCGKTIGQLVVVFGLVFAVLYLVLDVNLVLSVIGAGVIIFVGGIYVAWTNNGGVLFGNNKPPQSIAEIIREAREKRRKRR